MLSYRVYKRKLQIFMFKLTPVTSKIGQGHPSSNLTKTLLRYIHGISFGSMRLIFVELSCLQAKCWRTDGQTDRQTDGRTDRRTRQSNSRVGYTQPAQKWDLKHWECGQTKDWIPNFHSGKVKWLPRPWIKCLSIPVV